MQAIDRKELEAMNGRNNQDFVLINVLPRDKFLKEHIRTSINIPGEDADFASKVEQVAGSKDREVVLYCASFECPASTDAAKKLDEAGFSHVYDYEGGTKDWLENHH